MSKASDWAQRVMVEEFSKGRTRVEAARRVANIAVDKLFITSRSSGLRKERSISISDRRFWTEVLETAEKRIQEEMEAESAAIDRDAKISEALRGGGWMTKEEIAAASGVGLFQTGIALRNLVRTGYAVEDGGRYREVAQD